MTAFKPVITGHYRPTQDVVFCKDCKYNRVPFDYDTQTGCHWIDHDAPGDEDYCSMGELKDDEEDDW